MDLGVIAVRYARALLKSAVDSGCEDKIYNEMLSLYDSYLHIPQLRVTIENPMISAGSKKQLFFTACGSEVLPLTNRFISLVIKEKREKQMQFISASYITLYRKYKNIISGKLITATNVDKRCEDSIKQLVRNKTGATVDFSSEVDKNIIGGFILEYDTHRLDASVKSHLRRILTELKNKANVR